MGKYSNRKMSKISLLLLSLVLLLFGAVWGSIAYIVADTAGVSNQFEPVRVTCSVSDTVKDGVKSDVVVKNTGDASAYIRAAIIANWCDDNGAIVAPCNQADTSQVEFAGLAFSGSGWVKGTDGFYYYLYPVKAGQELKGTNALLVSCTAKESPVAGAHLEVTILAQAVQADGLDEDGNAPVVLAWGPTVVSVSEGNGSLSVKTE